MEPRNFKRKIRKSRKVLDQLRKRTLKSSDNIFQRNVNTSIQAKHFANVPNVPSNRLTLAMHSYRNVVISETIRRNLTLEKLMLSLNYIPCDRVSFQNNNLIINEMPSETQNIICKRNDGRGNGYLPRDYQTSSGIPSIKVIRALFIDFLQELTVYYRRTLPRLLNDEFINEYRRGLREAFEDVIVFHRQPETEAPLLSDPNDSLLNPLEYIRRRATTPNKINVFHNLDNASSQTIHVNIIDPNSTDSDVEDASSTSNTYVVTPSPTRFATLSDTPQCEYFPHKLN